MQQKVSAKVSLHFVYSIVSTTVIAIRQSWRMLKSNPVEPKPLWFSGLTTISQSLLTRVVSWVIVGQKLADDSDIAQAIISYNSEKEGKQIKVPFAEIPDVSVGFGFTKNVLLCRLQKHALIL